MPLILIFGIPQRFQDVIYAVRRLNKSPERGSTIALVIYYCDLVSCLNRLSSVYFMKMRNSF